MNEDSRGYLDADPASFFGKDDGSSAVVKITDIFGEVIHCCRLDGTYWCTKQDIDNYISDRLRDGGNEFDAIALKNLIASHNRTLRDSMGCGILLSLAVRVAKHSCLRGVAARLTRLSTGQTHATWLNFLQAEGRVRTRKPQYIYEWKHLQGLLKVVLSQASERL
jgi:hypothetical protein